MADYKETTVAGKQWQRCRYVMIDNPHQQVPQIRFKEEQVTTVGDQVFIQPVGDISFEFDPDAVIDLVNPSDGLPTGDQMTYQELYAAIWSLYISKATERDALAATAQPTETPTATV